MRRLNVRINVRTPKNVPPIINIEVQRIATGHVNPHANTTEYDLMQRLHAVVTKEVEAILKEATK